MRKWIAAGAGRHYDPKATLGLYAKVIASKTDHGAALGEIFAASGAFGV